jgi:putative transcriptional regulator
MAIVKITQDRIRTSLREIDWPAQDGKTDDDIAREIATNPDAAPILSAAQTAAGITRLIRQRLGITQGEFAARYQIPIGTLRDWEQNRKQPDAPRHGLPARHRPRTGNRRRSPDPSINGRLNPANKQEKAKASYYKKKQKLSDRKKI